MNTSSISDLWLHETPNGDASQWYEKSTTYWHDVPATVGGVLGGFGHLSGVDVKESGEFVRRVVASLRHAPKAPNVLFTRALDCGAGVGRTAKALLAPMCATVDLLEQDAKFLAKAERDMPPAKAGHFFCQSLQQFEPSERYQLVWVQWVLNYLTDADLLVFLRRVAAALTPDGVLFVKENMLASERESDCAYDAEDSSVTRSEAGFRAIFAAARLRVVERDVQKQFPAGMLPVRMYALVREPEAPEKREECEERAEAI
jgi:protein N-terminal methyltransferase